MERDNRLLGALLDNARLGRRLSVAEVARQSGVPLSVVQKVLAGDSRRPSWWAIVDIARVVHVPLPHLVVRAGGLPFPV